MKSEVKRTTVPQRNLPQVESYVYASIFLVGLLVFLIHLFTWVVPQWKVIQESLPADCTVQETRLQTKIEDGIEFYRPEVRISLLHGKETIVLWTLDSDTLTENLGFVADKSVAEKRLEPYAVGEKYTCWYPPDHPDKAVLYRRTTVWGWYFLAIPICLMFCGILGFFGTVRLFRISEERLAARSANRSASPLAQMIGPPANVSFPTVPDARMINESPGTELAFRLPTMQDPSLRLIGITVFTAIWNTVAWIILVWSLYHTGGSGWNFLCSVLFGLFFCGFGLVLLIGILHHLLTSFGIGPTILEISDHPIYPGRKYRLVLTQRGTLRFRQLSVQLVCEEIARFRQGTDTITSRKDVYTQPLFFREDFETTRDVPFRQELFLRLPLGAIHSMRLEHNEIVWKIVLNAKLIGLPDLNCESTIIVHPPAITERYYD